MTFELPTCRDPTPFCCVPPAGLLGQTFDRSNCTMVGGRRDNYSSHHNGSFVTRAQAEGAIEGVADDYMVQSAFDVVFAHGRFDSISAPPRATQLLAGRKGEQRCAPAPVWNRTGGPENVVRGLNFQGADLFDPKRPCQGTLCRKWRRVKSAMACYQSCWQARHQGCRAFTFITTAPGWAARCWLKREGYQSSAFRSGGTISGVLRLARG